MGEARNNECLLGLNPDTLNDFDVDGKFETADNWFSDQHIVEVSWKNLTKVSEAMAIEVSLL